MIRVWVGAALEDARMRSLSAAALDWGRRRMVRILGGGGGGDVDIEAVVMVALLGAFGSQPRSAAGGRRGGKHCGTRTDRWSRRALRYQLPDALAQECISPGQRPFRPSCAGTSASLVSESTSMSETPRRSRPVRRGPQECCNS